jgi:hypothetical protein
MFFLIVCDFPRYAREIAHEKIGRDLAAAGKNVAL